MAVGLSGSDWLGGILLAQINLQDTFLNVARNEKIGLTVYLMNGFQIKGTVTSFDNFTVALDTEGRQQLVYKHAISTIIPARPIGL